MHIPITRIRSIVGESRIGCKFEPRHPTLFLFVFDFMFLSIYLFIYRYNYHFQSIRVAENRFNDNK